MLTETKLVRRAKALREASKKVAGAAGTELIKQADNLLTLAIEIGDGRVLSTVELSKVNKTMDMVNAVTKRITKATPETLTNVVKSSVDVLTNNVDLPNRVSAPKGLVDRSIDEVLNTASQLEVNAKKLLETAASVGGDVGEELRTKGDSILKLAVAIKDDPTIIKKEAQDFLDSTLDSLDKSVSDIRKSTADTIDGVAKNSLDEIRKLNIPTNAEGLGSVVGAGAAKLLNTADSVAGAAKEVTANTAKGLAEGFNNARAVDAVDTQAAGAAARAGFLQPNADIPEEVVPKTASERIKETITNAGDRIKGLAGGKPPTTQADVDARRAEVVDYLKKQNGGKEPSAKQVDKVIAASGGLPDAEIPELTQARKMAEDLGVKNPSKKELSKVYESTTGNKLPGKSGLRGSLGNKAKAVGNVAARGAAPLAGFDVFNGMAIRMGEGMSAGDAIVSGISDTGTSLADFGAAVMNDPKGTFDEMVESFSLSGMARSAALTTAKGLINLSAGVGRAAGMTNARFVDPSADGLVFLPTDDELDARLEQEELLRADIVQAKLSGNADAVASAFKEQSDYRASNEAVDSRVFFAPEEESNTPQQTNQGLATGTNTGELPEGVRQVQNDYSSEPIYTNAEGRAFSDKANIATLSGGPAAPLPKNMESIITGDSAGVAGLNISAAAQANRAAALGVTSATDGPRSVESLQRKIDVDNELLSATTDPALRERIQASLDNDFNSLTVMTRGLSGRKEAGGTAQRKRTAADAGLTPQEAGNIISAGQGNASDRTIYNESLAEKGSGGLTDAMFSRSTPDSTKNVVGIAQNNHRGIPFIDATTTVKYEDGSEGTYENLDTSQRNVLRIQKERNRERLGLAP